ncbi:LamG-like jellyroll fold domain-containing protein [Flavobacterium sp. 3HN19-14]|uniref:LamG-like jellyroll fold domain-containing protein n=1 Tax=Flavobacterium sp. 3HN19-14 TaxID=3448133 RepID=UPI003EE36EB3
MTGNGDITFNTTLSTSASVTGIDTSGDGDYTINSNNIGGISASGSIVSLNGITITHASTNNGIINNNTIGGTTANSLQSTSTDTAARVMGIYGNALLATFTGNTIRNLTGSGSELSGIKMFTISELFLYNNNINTLKNNNAGISVEMNGINAVSLSTTADAIISGNTIHTLVGVSTDAASAINGIYCTSLNTHVFNNMIDLGNTVTQAIPIRGLYHTGTLACEYYNNSVYIGGSPTSGSGLSSALNAQIANTGLRRFNNNILVNSRSNNGATGNNVCAALVVNTRTVSDNNVYYGGGNGFYVGYDNNHSAYVADLAAWKTANNTDGSSFFGNPQYLTPTGTTPNLHINPVVQTIIESRGSVFNGLATDIDNETRSELTPSDIGADAGNFIAIPAPNITSLNTTSVCIGGSLVINGSGLATTTIVKIGTVTATVTNTTDSALTVTIPSGASGVVTVTTSVGTATSSQSVTPYQPLAINTQPVAPTTYCAGTGTTTISVSALNATGYVWRKGGVPLTNNAIYSNVTTNTLTITNPPYSENNVVFDVVISNPGCGSLTSNPVTLTLTPNAVTAVNASPATVCPGNAATLTATGATTYSWSPSTGLSATTGATVTATPSVTTVYTVTGTNGNGCFSSATVTVTVDNPSVNVVAGSSSICPGGSTSLTASGASTYAWSPSSGLSATTGATVTANPTTSTTYTVTGTNAFGCVASKSITITVKPAQEIVAYGATTFCSDSNVILGVKNKALQFNGTNNYMTLNRSVSDDFTIEYWIKTTQPNAAGADWYSGKGIIDGEISGNVNDFGVSLMNSKIAFGIGGGGTFTDKTIQSTTSVNTGQWFHVALTRTKSSGAIKIYINGVLEASDVSSNTNSLAAPSALRIGSLLNGSNYFSGTLDEIRIWNVVRTQAEIQSNINTDFSSGATGLLDYFKMNQRNGTSATNTANASNNGTLVNSPTWVNYESISSYLWSNNATTPEITVNTTGNFSLQTTDSDGCVRTSSSISTTVNPATIAGISPSSASICLGSGATLTASGGISYSWSPATGLNNTNTAVVTATPLVTTTYTVTATAANGCQASQSVTVTVNSPNVTASAASEIICAGGSTTLTATGGVSYAWSPSSGLSAVTGATVTANPTTTTTYTVTGTDAGGCAKSVNVIVIVKPIATITASGPTTFCQGGSVTLSSAIPVAGLQFNGTNNSVIANRNISDDFTIEFWMKTTQNTPETSIWYNAKGLVTSYGTPVTGAFGVTLNAGLLDFGVGNTEIRSTSSVNTGQWMHVAVTRTKASGAMQIYINGVLEKTGTATTASLTQQSLITLGLVGTGAYYSGSLDDVRIWNTVRTQSQISAGMNAVYPSGTPNLIDYFKLDETSGSAVSNTANPANPGTVVNAPTWITSGRNYQSYLWSNGLTTPSIAVNASGNYTVQVTNPDCSSTSLPTTITVNSLPIAAVTPSAPMVCPGGNVVLTASGGATYSWSPATELSATTGDIVTVTPTATRTYTVTVTSASGCVSSQTVTVTLNNPAISVTPTDVAICAGGSTTLTASGMLNYTWSPSTGLSAATGASVTASPSETTTYTVTGTDAAGCSRSASVVVAVKGTSVITAGGPTTFCPGGSVVLSSTIPVKGLQFNGTTPLLRPDRKM